MSDSAKLEVYRSLRSAQDRYVYFLLAASGAGIGFAITRTATDTLTLAKIPLGLAVLCWGLSFYFGCRSITWTNSALNDNGARLDVQAGQHPDTGRHPEAIAFGAQALAKIIDDKSDKVAATGALQFGLLVAGAILFVAWHVVEMWLRT